MRTSASNSVRGLKTSLAICSPSNNRSWRDEVTSPRPKHNYRGIDTALGYKNLACVWENYKELGTQCAVIPNVLEERNDIQHFEQAIPGAKVIVVRLKAPLTTINNR